MLKFGLLFVALFLSSVITCLAATDSPPQPYDITWSVRIKAVGEVAHMHIREEQEGDKIVISGYIKPTKLGQKHNVKPEQITSYLADQSYALQENRPYNGYTMPLLVRYLAGKRRKALNEIRELVIAIAISEDALLALG